MFGRPWLSTATSKKSSIVRVPGSQDRPWLQIGPLWTRPDASFTVQSGAALSPLLLCAYETFQRFRQLSLTGEFVAVPAPGQPSVVARVEEYHAMPTLPALPAASHGKTFALPVPGSTACGVDHAAAPCGAVACSTKMRLLENSSPPDAFAGRVTSPVKAA